MTAPPSRNSVLLSEKPAAEGTWAENLVQQKALVKKFGRQTGARYYQKVEEMRVDGGLKEEMILKAAGNAVGLMEPATEVEQKEDGLSHLLPPRNDMAQNKEMVCTRFCKMSRRKFCGVALTGQCCRSTRWRAC